MKETVPGETDESLGYQEIHLDFPSDEPLRQFGGLRRTENGNLFDGTNSDDSYWYSIGYRNIYYKKKTSPWSFLWQ